MIIIQETGQKLVVVDSELFISLLDQVISYKYSQGIEPELYQEMKRNIENELEKIK